MWLLTTDYQGRTCFRVLWGRYPSPEAAKRAQGRTPAFFSTAHNRPAVVAVPRNGLSVNLGDHLLIANDDPGEAGRFSGLPVRDAPAAGTAQDLSRGAQGDSFARPRRRDPASLLREGGDAHGDVLARGAPMAGGSAHRRLPASPRLHHRHGPQLGAGDGGQAGPRAPRKDPRGPGARIADGARPRDAPPGG